MKKLIALLMALVLTLSVTGVVAFAETSDPVVVVDGVMDDSYNESMSIPNDWWYCFSSNTTVCEPVDKERVKNTLYFQWDDDYLYFYFLCESKDDLIVPEEGVTLEQYMESSSFIEQISIYLDAKPSAPIDQALKNDGVTPSSDFDRNCISGAAPYNRLMARYFPYYDMANNYFRTDEGMFLTMEEFTERREGEDGYEDLEAMYLKENGDCEFVGFSDYDANTYGCEFKYRRVEGEDHFRINITTQANEKDWDEYGPELGYTVSATSAWWRNFEGMFEIYFEDYQGEDPMVAAAQRSIAAIPDEITIEHADAINDAVLAVEKLDEDQLAQLTEAELTKLGDAVATIAVLQLAVTIGDVDAGTGEEINATDALIVLRAAVGKQELDEEQQIRADVNGDEDINASDALEILKYAVKKIDTFKVVEEMMAALA